MRVSADLVEDQILLAAQVQDRLPQFRIARTAGPHHHGFVLPPRLFRRFSAASTASVSLASATCLAISRSSTPPAISAAVGGFGGVHLSGQLRQPHRQARCLVGCDRQIRARHQQLLQ